MAARANSVAVPFGEKNEPRWQGIGYQLGGVRLVSSMGEVIEVLKVPRYTPVPGVREWMLGIANIRGRLIPIIDLHVYLGIEQTLPQAAAQVLVVEAGLCGLAAGRAEPARSHRLRCGNSALAPSEANAWNASMVPWHACLARSDRSCRRLQLLTNDSAQSRLNRRALVVMHRTTNREGMSFYAIASSGLPRLLHLAEDEVRDIEDGRNSGAILSNLTLGTEAVVVPNLRYLEDQVSAVI